MEIAECVDQEDVLDRDLPNLDNKQSWREERRLKCEGFHQLGKRNLCSPHPQTLVRKLLIKKESRGPEMRDRERQKGPVRSQLLNFMEDSLSVKKQKLERYQMIMFMNKYLNKISGFSSRGEGGKPVWTKRGQTRGQVGGREGGQLSQNLDLTRKED